MELMGTMELLCLNRANAMLIGEQGFFWRKNVNILSVLSKKKWRENHSILYYLTVFAVFIDFFIIHLDFIL